MDHLKEIEKTLQQQITSFKELLNSLKGSLNSATKSSVGDKHETSRAHVQIEMDQVGKQLQLKEAMLAELLQITHNINGEDVGIGSIVKTDVGTFCICVGAGKIEGLDVIAISKMSPMAQELIGKSTGDRVVVNGKEIVINSIE